MLIEAVVADTSVDVLNEWIVGRRARVAGPTECQFDTTAVRPGVQRLRGKLLAVVDLDNRWQPM